MFMALPPGIPTLSHKRWKKEYRPDNVFLSTSLQKQLLSCATNRSLTPTGADHYPILTVLDFSLGTAMSPEFRNFRNVDWDEFRKELRRQLEPLGVPRRIRNQDDFDAQAYGLHSALAKTVELTVPRIKLSQHMKRWWTVELTARRKELRVLGNEAHKYRYVPDHPSHHIFRQAEQNYQDAIRKQKYKHWEEWMTHVSGKDIWTANKFISGP
ncbi:hypothetical protein NEOLEDRAFT_1029458, partial [Neolentinus lepideus HHB14362 ss-1]